MNAEKIKPLDRYDLPVHSHNTDDPFLYNNMNSDSQLQILGNANMMINNSRPNENTNLTMQKKMEILG